MVALPGPGNFRADGGDGRRGLGGLWSLLNTIATGIGAIPTLAADVAQIKGDIRRLVGTTAPGSWTGLPNIIGGGDEFGGETVGGYLSGQDELLSLLLQVLRPTPSNNLVLAIRNEVLALRGSPVTDLRAILGAVDGLESTATTIAGALQDPNFLPSVPYLRQLLDAIGRYSDDPAALTVKQLLKAQVECCEGGGTPGGGLNPAPSALCISADGWSAPVRCTRFEEIPNGSNSGVYGVVFDAGLAAIGLQNQADISPTWDFPGLKSLSGDAVEVCFSWDLAPFAGTGLAYNRYNTVAASWGSGDQLAAGSVSLQPSPQAAQATIPAGQAVGLQIILDAPGTLPGLNFFVKARGVAS